MITPAAAMETKPRTVETGTAAETRARKGGNREEKTEKRTGAATAARAVETAR